MLCSQVSYVNGNVYVTTTPAASMKLSTVNMTLRKSAKAELSQEANEVVKIIVPMQQYGLIAFFTSIMKIYILDLFTMTVLTELKS